MIDFDFFGGEPASMAAADRLVSDTLEAAAAFDARSEAKAEAAPELLGPGLHRDVPMSDYLALPYMSASRLETLLRSPLQYQASLTAPSKSTPALERGTALHLAVLEPHLFAGRYVVLGQCAGRKKGGEPCGYQGSVYRHGESWCKTHDPERGEDPDTSVEVLPQADHDAVSSMAEAIRTHPRARTLFEGAGEVEATIVFDDPETGVRCRIRPDRLIERAGMLVDIKTTRDARAWQFASDAEKRGYWRKMALYRRGLCAIGWPYASTAIVAVESTPPAYDLCCYLLEEEDIERADEDVSRALRIYQACEADGRWPGYADDFQVLRRPAYAMRDEDE